MADTTPHTTQHNGTNYHVVGSGMDLVRNRDPCLKQRQPDLLQMGLEEGLAVGGACCWPIENVRGYAAAGFVEVHMRTGQFLCCRIGRKKISCWVMNGMEICSNT